MFLSDIKDVRNKILISKTKEEIIKYSNQLTKELCYLFSLTEEYIEIKMDKDFLRIQNKLQELNDQISNSINIYNDLLKLVKKKNILI